MAEAKAKAKAKALVLLLVLFFMKVTGGTTQNDPSGQRTWCVAEPSSDDATVTEKINYACSMTSCESLIDKGGSCFLPDNRWNHASVVMNLYYQVNGRNEWNCHFQWRGQCHYQPNVQVWKKLGMPSQVVDDILDFTQSAEQLGKPVANDLAKGNLTAPVIFTLQEEPKLRDIIESEFCETGSLDEAISLIKFCGCIGRARQLAKEKADLAIQSLICFPQSPFRLALEDMVVYNLKRIE